MERSLKTMFALDIHIAAGIQQYSHAYNAWEKKERNLIPCFSTEEPVEASSKPIVQWCLLHKPIIQHGSESRDEVSGEVT